MARRQKDRPGLRRWQWLLGITIFGILLAAGTWMLLFRMNRFSLEVRLVGEENLEVEYGQSYEEPGAEVVLRGSLLWKEGIVPRKAQLHITGEVNEEALGRYTRSYRAEYFGLQAQAERRVAIIDTQCPVIVLSGLGENPGGHGGYTATDNYDGDITHQVKRIVSEGKITYSVIDSSGNPAWVEQEVPGLDPAPPKIFLEGGERITVTVGTLLWEPGYYAEDTFDGNLTEQVQVEGEVDWLTPGVYPVTYHVADGHGNRTSIVREVEVAAVPRPEVHWPGEKTIYLTFDDGPGPYTRQLLDILDAYGVKATFFVTGTSYGNVMKEIVDRGHSIGIHTVTHQYHQIYESPEAYFADLLGMQQIIYDHTGVKTTLLRFPGGSSNAISKETYEGLMTILTEAVQDAGFQYFDWNVDSLDAGGAKDAQEVAQNVIDGIQKVGTSMVLQHDIHSCSVEAVEQIIQWGLENGYVFRALTQNSPGFHHNVYN